MIQLDLVTLYWAYAICALLVGLAIARALHAQGKLGYMGFLVALVLSALWPLTAVLGWIAVIVDGPS